MSRASRERHRLGYRKAPQPYRLTWRQGVATVKPYIDPLTEEQRFFVMVDGESVANRGTLEEAEAAALEHNTDPYHGN